MNKVVGWAIGGAVLSITVGVLVGVVLHAGQLERADRTQPASIPTRSAAFPPSPARSTPVASPSSTSVVTWLPPSTPGTQPPTEVAVPTDVPTDQPPDTTTGMTQSSAPATTSGTAGAAVSSTPVSSTPVSGTPASGTATVPHLGADMAGAPCPKLAAASSDAAGTTLYCQVDQKDRTLRWRAVVDGGGCLSRTMTGYAADGRLYLCRLDGSGLNHWASAS
jgi:hypothetical protein